MKLYILEFWVHDYDDSFSDIIGVYSDIDKGGNKNTTTY